MSDENAFEGKVRVVIHDILFHLHKTWAAFSSAAAQMNLTAEQAEASLLAKAVSAIKEDSADEAEMGELLVLSFVLDALEVLPRERRQHLDDMSSTFGKANWKEAARNELEAEYGLTPAGIKEIYAACTNHMNGMHSVLFVLRGVGCVQPVSTLVELLGQERVQEFGERIIAKHPGKS